MERMFHRQVFSGTLCFLRNYPGYLLYHSKTTPVGSKPEAETTGNTALPSEQFTYFMSSRTIPCSVDSAEFPYTVLKTH